MKINVFKYNEMPKEYWNKIMNRSEIDISMVFPGVQEIIDAIKSKGDEAIIHYIKKFDKVDLTNIPFRVTEEEFKEAEASIAPNVKDAILYSIENVKEFHRMQVSRGMELLMIRPGVFAGERTVPINSCGLYVPRGKGSFPSMMYMMAVPAVTAGVNRIVVVSPPGEDSKVDAGTLFAASACGLKEVYRIGGPMAIAALTFGTKSIPGVDKIIGPGNNYVTAAKRLLSGIKDFGLPAGPSDSAVIADEFADPYKVALDLLVEAEHGSDSSAILVTTSQTLADRVVKIIPGIMSELSPMRYKFIEDVLSGYGAVIIAENMDQAVDFINDYAPEHLQIQTRSPFDLLDKIKNAAEILLGDNTVFSLANYSTGANAVLPTGGKAKTYSPLSVRDFIKYSSIVYVTENGYTGLKDKVIALADYEGFESHGAALKKRP